MVFEAVLSLLLVIITDQLFRKQYFGSGLCCVCRLHVGEWSAVVK